MIGYLQALPVSDSQVASARIKIGNTVETLRGFPESWKEFEIFPGDVASPRLGLHPGFTRFTAVLLPADMYAAINIAWHVLVLRLGWAEASLDIGELFSNNSVTDIIKTLDDLLVETMRVLGPIEKEAVAPAPVTGDTPLWVWIGGALAIGGAVFLVSR